MSGAAKEGHGSFFTQQWLQLHKGTAQPKLKVTKHFWSFTMNQGDHILQYS